MKIAGSYTFSAPRNEVWEALQDPGVLTKVLPGCERLEQTGEHEYVGELNIKVGPVQGKFQGNIELEDIDEPNGYSMKVDGRGAPGFVRATARLDLAEAEGGDTTLTYDADAQVGGRIASVGQRLLDSSAKAIIKESLTALDGLFAARASAAAEGKSGEEAESEAVAAAARSQTQFAAGIAKEVAKDIMPPAAWVAVIVALILLALAILYLF